MKILISILILFTQNTYAEVFVRHPDTPNVEFIKNAATGQTIIEHLQSALPAEVDEKRLVSKFERAQTLFLSPDPTAAKVAFIEVTEEALRSDWTETQRLAILNSFLRVAQLSSDPEQVQSYLQKASEFALSLDIERSLFPPPLVNQFEQIRQKVKSKSVVVDLRERFPQHDLIIINGEVVSAADLGAYSVPSGRHRVTALSNSHQPITQELTASQLSLIRAEVPPFAIGTCDEPALSGYQKMGLESVTVVFAKDCVKTYTGTTWIKSTQNLSTAIPPTFSVSGTSQPLESSAPQPLLTRKKLMWLGIGAGVIVTAMLLIKNSKKRGEEIQPVERQGF